jgi:iron complex outermembrane receptor protein
MKYLYITVFLILGIPTQAQNITGKVIDSNTKKPIQKAIIKVISSGNFTETNEDGIFKISANNNEKAEIIHMNYNTLSLNLSDNMTIELHEKPIKLDEILIKTDRFNDLSQSVTIIDNIKSTSQPRNVSDLFKDIKGFGIQKRGAYASEPIFIISLRRIKHSIRWWF